MRHCDAFSETGGSTITFQETDRQPSVTTYTRPNASPSKQATARHNGATGPRPAGLRSGNGNGAPQHSPRHNGEQPADHANPYLRPNNGNGNGHTAPARPRPTRTAGATLPRFAPETGCGRLLGECEHMQQVYRMITKVAATDATVFVCGESGTGKELVAEAIHQQSTRAHRPFVPINCGAIPEGLIDSELFGHEKGAFTGASRSRGGVFEQADGGTIFLDEITEMPIDLQARLLRVLETGRVRRVGSDRDVFVDVRVITASNRPASTAVDQGRLREDLLYRLSVFPIDLPPLRERGGDTILLAEHFLAEMNDQTGQQRRFNTAALELIRAYPWPGNVRQLKHAVQRASILADGPTVEARYLPSATSRQPTGNQGQVQLPVGTSIAEAEQQLIYATLDHYDGDKKEAAEVLGMSLRTLYNRLNIYKAQKSETNGAAKSRG